MDQRQSQAPIVVVGTAGLDGQVAAAIEHAARRLSSEEEREQVLGIKDLWSLSCDDPQFAIAIGQCGPLLDRLLELCSLASCPSYAPSPSLPPGPSWKLVILALHCLWFAFSIPRFLHCLKSLIPSAPWGDALNAGTWRPTRRTNPL